MRSTIYQRSVGGAQCPGGPLRSRAFTMAEVLIVVLIVAVVTIATIPLLKPAMDGRRIREAARIVTTQFASAQAEAVSTGHSVGIWMEKIPLGGASGAVEGEASMDLFLCESPPPYSGDSESSTVTVSVSGSPLTGNVTMSSTDTAWVGLLRKGDLIRFNHTGPYYALTGPAATDGTLQQATVPAPTVFSMVPISRDDFDTFGNPAFRNIPPAAQSTGGWTTTFQIIRQPVKSASTPVQLPTSAVVDLYCSGMGNSGSYGYFGAAVPNLHADKNPVIVTFDRTGTLEYLYAGGTQVPITLPLYFLIGKREQTPSVALGPSNLNWADQENLWISLNPQSGLASTAEVASPNFIGSLGQQIVNSRAFATAAQAMGGK